MNKNLLSILLILFTLCIAVTNLFAQTDPNEYNNSFKSATPIVYGDTVKTAYIYPVGDIDFYSFNGNALDSIKVDMIIIDTLTLDGKIILFSADSTVIAISDDKSVGNEGFTVVLPATGKYYIGVSYWEYLPVGQSLLALPERTGKYWLALKFLGKGSLPVDINEPNNNIATATPLVYGTAKTGFIYPASDVDFYSFSSTVGDSIKIELLISGYSNLNGKIELFSSSGSLLSTVNDNIAGKNETLTLKVPVTGKYYVSVSYWEISSGVKLQESDRGKYAIKVSKIASVPVSVVQGKVVNFNTGAPVKDAVIKVKMSPLSFQGASSEEISMDTTDVDGNYKISLARGLWLLTISNVGYQSAEFFIDVKGDKITKNVKLIPSASTVVYTNSFELNEDEGWFSTKGATPWTKSSGFTFVSSMGDSVSVRPSDENTFLVVGGKRGYKSNENSWWMNLTNTNMDLTRFARATVTFDVWYYTELDLDYLCVLANQPNKDGDSYFVLDINGDGVGNAKDKLSGNSKGWVTISADLSPFTGNATGEGVEVAFLFRSDKGTEPGFGVAIDNIIITGYDTCLPPAENLIASNFQDSKVVLTWDAHPSKVEIFKTMRLTIGQSNMTLDKKGAYLNEVEPYQFLINRSGVKVSSFVQYNVFRKSISSGGDWELIGYKTNNVYVDYNVSNNKVYKYFVTVVYDEGESKKSNFVTASPGTPVVSELPIQESFERVNLPTGWLTEIEGNNNWAIGDTTKVGTWFSKSNKTKFAYIDDDGAGAGAISNTILVTPLFDASALENIYLKYRVFFNSDGINTLYIVGRESFGEWKIIKTISQSTPTWVPDSLNISNLFAGKTYIQIGFWYNDNGAWSWGCGIDDVIISHPPIGNIRGVVKNSKNNNLLANVKVELKNEKTYKTTKTDSLGRYSFNNIPIGKYEVTVSMLNFTGATKKDITVADKQTTTVDFAIAPIQPPVRDFYATPGNAKVNLRWSAPLPLGEIAYDDGEAEDLWWFDRTGGFINSIATRFTVPFDGNFVLTNVAIFGCHMLQNNTMISDATIVRSKNGLPDMSDTLGIVSSITILDDDWTFVNFESQNVSVSSASDFFVVLRYSSDKNGPAVYADYTSPDNRSYWYSKTNGWRAVVDTVNQKSFDWMIRAYINSTSKSPELISIKSTEDTDNIVVKRAKESILSKKNDLNILSDVGLRKCNVSRRAPEITTKEPFIQAVKYNILRGTTSGVYTNIANTTQTTYTDASVTNGTKYYYVVDVVYGTESSEHSTEIAMVPQAVVSLPYASDFEADNGGFQSGYSYWQWGTLPTNVEPRTAPSGTKVWGVGLSDTTYQDGLNQFLLSPPFDLQSIVSQGKKPYISFNLWYELEVTNGVPYDFCYFMLDKNSDGIFETVIDEYSGASKGWLNFSYIIPDSLASNYLRFALLITTDQSNAKRGVFLDDFKVSSYTAPIINLTPTAVNLTITDPAVSDTTFYIEISNTGASNLLYDISVKYPKDTSTLPSDSFGYKWTDSDKSSEVVFDWLEISTMGTKVPLNDDDGRVVSLPFTFPFYGKEKTTVNISSNGYLTFGNFPAVPLNDSIPSTNQPNDLIAPFWDDLFFGLNSAVYYQYDLNRNRFIIQYDKMSHSNGGPYTFQVILCGTDGSIIFQYLNMNGALNQATIGIENSNGTDGLKIAFNKNYVHNNLAVKIAPPGVWLSVKKPSGVVLPGKSTNVEFVADASKLKNGTYNASLEISSNASSPNKIVPVVLNVSRYIANVSADTLKLSFVPSDKDTSYSLTISNAVNTELSYTTTITYSTGQPDKWILVQPSTGTVPPLGSTTIILFIKRSTMDVGNYSASINIACNSAIGPQNIVVGINMNVQRPIPGKFELSQNYPNPFYPPTTIPYKLAKNSDVQLIIYNVLGQEVIRLVDKYQPAGSYSVSWNGKDDRLHDVPAGFYILQIVAKPNNEPAFTKAIKIMLVR